MTQGTAGFPVDSKATTRVRQILNRQRWNNFGQSQCNADFGHELVASTGMITGNGRPYAVKPATPTSRVIQKWQNNVIFYDTGNNFQQGTFGDLKMSQIGVTYAGGKLVGQQTLSQWLGTANAAVPNLPIVGSGGPALLHALFLQYPANGDPNQSNYPQFTLVHEVLLHAYVGVSDTQMLYDNFFSLNGLFDTGQGSIPITGWMSTDCTCTPGHGNCQANIATW